MVKPIREDLTDDMRNASMDTPLNCIVTLATKGTKPVLRVPSCPLWQIVLMLAGAGEPVDVFAPVENLRHLAVAHANDAVGIAAHA